jgi:hypothetical protein
MSKERLEIRASSLSSYWDCPRRGAVRLFRKKVQDSGFELRTAGSSIAAHIGTAVHKAIAELLRLKQQFGDITRHEIDLATEKAVRCGSPEEKCECLSCLVNIGTIWDKTTPHFATAEAQIRAMLEAYAPGLESIEPRIIEHKFEYEVSPLGEQAIPILLTGTIDLYDAFAALWDHKTGSNLPSAHPQAGAYIMLLELHDYPVERFILNYCKREGIRKTEAGLPPPLQLILDIEECTSAAWSALAGIQRHFEDYLETGDPWAFPANPQSRTCTAKYCTAFDTEWCKVGGRECEE